MLDVKCLIGLLNLSQKEEYLLKLYVSKNVTKDEIYHLLYGFGYNIEKETLYFNFLLAHLFQNNPNIEIPNAIEPRLKGVLRWFQYRNILLLSGLKRFVVGLNINNIPILFMKGVAMRILESNKTRMMADVDCAVNREDFDKAIKISEKLGFKVNTIYRFATEIENKPMQKIDIHKKIIKSDNDTEYIEKKIFERSKQYSFSGSKVFIPVAEDMIFLLLANGYDNIIYFQPFYKNVSWLFDVVYILRSNNNIDWNIIVTDAKETGTLAQLKIMFELINHFLPNTIPNTIISSINVSKQEYDINVAYTKNHLFFGKAQHLREQLINMVKGNENFNFFLALKLICQFLYLKIIQRIPIINYFFFNIVANRMFKI